MSKNDDIENGTNITKQSEKSQNEVSQSLTSTNQRVIPVEIPESKLENIQETLPVSKNAGSTSKLSGNRKPKPRPLMLSAQSLTPDRPYSANLPSPHLYSILKRQTSEDIADNSGSTSSHHNISFATKPYFFHSSFLLSPPNTPTKQKFFSESVLQQKTSPSAQTGIHPSASNPSILSPSPSTSTVFHQNPTNSSTVIFDNELPVILEQDIEDDVQEKRLRNRSYYIRRASRALWKSTRSLLGDSGHGFASQTTSFYRIKVALYQFLEYPTTWFAYFYHFVICMIILTGLIFYILSTTKNEETWSTIAMRATDITIATILVLEYFLRLWASSCIRRYQGLFGKLRFIFLSPFRIIDLILIAIAGLTLWASWEPKYRYNIYWLRAGHIFQILRLETRFKTLRVVREVIYELRTQLVLTAYLCFLSLITISSVIYFIEVSDENSPIINLPMALWWGIVTSFGIGYGDITPSTTWGKSVAAFLIVPTLIIWALPAGLIATGLALKVERLARKKVWIKRQEPAARLIQIGWQRYATNPFNTHLTATWNHLLNNEEKYSSNEQGKFTSSSFLDLRSVLEDQIWLKRPASWLKLSRSSTGASPQAPPSSATSVNQMHPGKLTNAKKNVIRAILKMKYLVAARKFHLSFRLTNVSDLIDQYNETQTELLATFHKNNKVLRSLHHDMVRLEFVLRQFQNSQNFQQTQINRIGKYFENWISDGNEFDENDDYGIQMKATNSSNVPETSNNLRSFRIDSPFGQRDNVLSRASSSSSSSDSVFKHRRASSF